MKEKKMNMKKSVNEISISLLLAHVPFLFDLDSVWFGLRKNEENENENEC